MALAAVVIGPLTAARAAEPEVVGVLALAVRDDVAKQLGLSDQQRTELQELVDRRELESLELLAAVKELSPGERAARLAPFRAESEALGLALLDADQKTRLEQIRLAKKGLASLVEPAVEKALGLSNEQRTKVIEILTRREQEPPRGEDSRRVEAMYEQMLAGVLSAEQQQQWSALAGGVSVPGAAQPAAAPPVGPPTSATAAQPDPGAATGVPPAGTAPPMGTAAATAASPPPAATPPASNAAAPPTPAEPRLTFNFRYQPWPDVLDWFASQAGLSLVLDAPPTGTFNYTDPRSYTPAEALDLINSVLLTKGYTLVRRERMLMLVNLEDGVPPNLVTPVPLEELPRRGEFELLSVLFPVSRISAEEMETEIRKLIGPQGNVVVLPKAGLIQVTETAGRLRMIRDVVEAVERPEGAATAPLRILEAKHALVEDVLAVARPLLDIADGAFAAADGSIRLSVDPLTGKLLASGKPDKLARLEEILQVVDVPLQTSAAGPVAVAAPQLMAYSVAGADSASALAVLQTLLAGEPDVRLATDPKTGNLIALARPDQHATIRATLEELQRDTTQVEVLRLSTLDPQLALLAIQKMFGDGGAGAPKIEADPVARQLLVRGSPIQIQQIRDLLTKMGETIPQPGEASAVSRGNVRVVPLSGRTVAAILEQVEALWPTLKPNRIRVITPSQVIPTLRPGGSANGGAPAGLPPGLMLPPIPAGPAAGPVPAAPPEPPADSVPRAAPSSPPPPAVPADRSSGPAATSPSADEGRSARTTGGGVPAAAASFRRAADPAPAEDAPHAGSAAPAPAAAPPASAAPPATTAGVAPTAPAGAEILVAPGPWGVILASDDLAALDQFESLLMTLAGRSLSGGREFTIFFLENSDAVVATEVLEKIFGTGSAAGGGSLIGDLAGAALGGDGGGLVGSLLSAATSTPASTASGGVLIVPDVRLNALVVYGTAAELDMIEQLLRILDQRDVPDSQVAAQPRLIPLYHSSANEVASVVREVFQENLVGGNRGRQPSPEELIQALRGGRGGGTTNARRSLADAMRMTLAVDARSNSLIVAAPQALFTQVEELVRTLDTESTENVQTVRVVSLKAGNPDAVQKALAALTGSRSRQAPAASTTTPGDASGGAAAAAPALPGGPSPDAQMQEQMRQRLEFFQRLRDRGLIPGGGGPGGGMPGGFPGGGPPPFPGGFPGRPDGGRDGGGGRGPSGPGRN